MDTVSIEKQPSTIVEHEGVLEEETLSFMQLYDKQDITDGMHVCFQILKKMKILNDAASESMSPKASILGEKFAQCIVKTLGENCFTEEDELFLPDEEVPLTNAVVESQDSTSSSIFSDTATSQSSEEEYTPMETSRTKHFVPIDTKIKILKMVRDHPNWSLRTIQQKGGTALKNKTDLKKWQQQIEQGGGKKEKYFMINKWTYDRFVEARDLMRPVSTRILQQWATQAATQFQGPHFKFTASPTWVTKFKTTHSIRQRKVTRYLKSTKALDLPTIWKEAEKFQKRVANIIKSFSPDFVINTDQTGCEYRVDVRRTLATKGQKMVDVFLGDFNKVTHSYTAQYALTASGKLLPKVFLCMQEPKGVFGPRVSANVEELCNNYGNIFVTASKSGKLTKEHFTSFVKNVVTQYCKQNRFLIILDSWGGQTDTAHFNSIFTDDDGNCSSTLEIIPPHCTPYCQPCDVYFFRQVKNFIKKIQNCVEVLENNLQLSTREDAIKIHSLIHHQLSAPVFQPMIQYAWYASKLIPNRTIFSNVNEICFSTVRTSKCDCKSCAFIRCAVCKKHLCFSCFYSIYHPTYCST